MTCIKTGCRVWLVEYQEFAYGDAHEFYPWQTEQEINSVLRVLPREKQDMIHSTLLLRLVSRVRPSQDDSGITDIHFIVYHINEWFDKDSKVSTLITNNYKNLGYYGLPFEKAKEYL